MFWDGIVYIINVSNRKHLNNYTSPLVFRKFIVLEMSSAAYHTQQTSISCIAIFQRKV